MKTLLDRKGEQFQTAVRALNGQAEWRSGLDFPRTCSREKLAPPISSSSVTSRESGSLSCTGSRQLHLESRTAGPGGAERSFVILAQARGIAWKDVREARRAVLDALPFLQQAETVMIVEILEAGCDQSSRAIKDVSNYLTRHGIKTIVERLRPADVTPANSLLRADRGQKHQLDGHGRLRTLAVGRMGVWRRDT